MNRNTFIANRLREVLLDGRWIANTNYREQLLNTNWKQAVFQVDGLNTIAKLTFHINYYLQGILNAFATGKLEISDKFSFYLPPLNSEDDWQKLMNDFLKNAEKFVTEVEQMDDSKFDEPFIDEKYGSFLNIEGVIEHSYYHLGQIVMINKLIAEKD
ncbi:DinB family protein [Niabella ginsengisoli]|uniref:DinB family protein n=1 Tax=Niabella ginsengisoli TaxID=522298 RepID=A0ABS9SJ38_9BACT|nr:DinB family protein [Niabella ginsengisoli]MCH5598326.1 DinB family protein [Niabella ginsengisoli]